MINPSNIGKTNKWNRGVWDKNVLVSKMHVVTLYQNVHKIYRYEIISLGKLGMKIRLNKC